GLKGGNDQVLGVGRRNSRGRWQLACSLASLARTHFSADCRKTQTGSLYSLEPVRSTLLIVLGSNPRKNSGMSEHIYKKIELVGSSPDGFDAAVKNAVERASKTIRNMRWFEVAETRGQIDDNKINHWQVTLKVGFT